MSWQEHSDQIEAQADTRSRIFCPQTQPDYGPLYLVKPCNDLLQHAAFVAQVPEHQRITNHRCSHHVTSKQSITAEICSSCSETSTDPPLSCGYGVHKSERERISAKKAGSSVTPVVL